MFLIILSALLLAPIFLFLPQPENLGWLIGLGILLGLAVLFLLYKKWPFLLVAMILPAIIVGPVLTVSVRQYAYEISLAEILILAACLIVGLETLGRRQPNLRMNPVAWALLGVIGLSVLSLLWAENTSRALIAVRVLIYHFLVFFLVINVIKTRKDWQRSLWALPLTAFLVALQLFFKVLSLGGWQTIFIPERTQLVTPVGSWVFVSAIIVLCLPLSLTLLLTLHPLSPFSLREGGEKREKRESPLLKKASLFETGWTVFRKPEFSRRRLGLKWWSPLLFLMIIFALLSSLFTLGKGEILSLAAGLGYFFKKQRRQRWLTILVVITVLVLVGTLFAQYGSQFWQRIVTTFSDQNTRFRLEELKAGLKVFSQHPFFGVGVGNLKLVYRQALPWFVETESNNIIIQILAELGVMGLVAAGFLVKAIFDIFSRDRSRLPRTTIRGPVPTVERQYCCVSTKRKILLLGFQSTMVVAVVNSLVEVTFIGLNYGIIFWYIVGLLVAWRQFQFQFRTLAWR